MFRQGHVEGDVVAVGVANGELSGLEQAPWQMFGGVGEVAGQVREGVEELGERVGCCGEGHRIESSEPGEGTDVLVFQAVVDAAEGGGVGVVGGAVLCPLQEVVPAVGDVVRQEVQPVSFALALPRVAALGAFQGGGSRSGRCGRSTWSV